MFRIGAEPLERVRDRLREGGARPTLILSPAFETLARQGLLSSEEQSALARVEPLAEVMFLMMLADGSLHPAEREVLRGAVRTLSADAIRSGTFEVMLESFAESLREVGRDGRLDEILSVLSEDEVAAECALVLAAAIAFADGDVSDEENALINDLADRLGIEESRANVLLDELSSG